MSFEKEFVVLRKVGNSLPVSRSTTSKKKVVIHLTANTTTRQLNNRQVVKMALIVTACVAFVVASFVSGVNYAYALEPDAHDADLSDYYYRMGALRDIFYVLMAMGIVGSLMVPFFLTRAYHLRNEVGPTTGHRSDVMLSWILLAACLHLLGSGIGYVVTVTPWLASH